MIERMKKVSIVGSKQELKPVIETLKSTGAFEVSLSKQTKNDLAEIDNGNRDRLAAIQSRVKAVLNFARSSESALATVRKAYAKKNPQVSLPELPAANKAVWSSVNEIEYSDLKTIAQYEDIILTLIEELEKHSAKLGEIKANLTKNSETIKELRPYINLKAAFNTLCDTQNSFVLCGIMPESMLEKFKADFDLSKFFIDQYPSSGGKVCVVAIGHHDDFPIINAIYDYRFERCKFNFEQNAKDTIKTLGADSDRLNFEYLTVLQKCILSEENIRMLKIYADYVSNELDTYELLSGTLQTHKYYVLNGWVPEKDSESAVSAIKVANPGVIVQINDAGKHDNPPVLVKNSKLVTPYQSVTNMYGAPSKNDIDPNPFVAFFYFLFFGIMLGDAGYGLLLFGATLFIILKKKPAKSMKNMLMLFCMGGVSAVLWGLFFGSFFGFGPADGGIWAKILPPAVISPIDNAIVFLALSLCLGIAHIIFGIILNFYNQIRHGQILDALFDSLSRIIMLIGVVIFAGALLLEPLASLSSLGIFTALFGLAVIVLTNGRKKKGVFGKIIGGFSGAYSVINYFSDILSYARLFGLGLVGAVIGMVANIIGGMVFGIPVIGIPLGILFAVIFHAFNLGLGLLSAYVHNARLQFVEFFGKFYSGEGANFRPIGGNLKYTRIKPVYIDKNL